MRLKWWKETMGGDENHNRLIYSGLASVIPKGYVNNKNINYKPQTQKQKSKQKKSSAPHGERCSFGDEGPTSYIEIKETKNKH
jgi:hypothetical protein